MRFYLFVFSLLTSLTALSQPASTYYTSSTLDGKSGQALELALAAIINPHTKISYDKVDEQFVNTDVAPNDSLPSNATGRTDLVWDMYAWISQFPKYYELDDHSQTGGFNKEHIVPNSWWGGKSGNDTAYSDMYNLVPGDGAANNEKSNWPLGEYKSGMTLSWPTADKTGNTNNSTFYNSYYAYKDTGTHSEGTLGVQCSKGSNPASHVWKVSDSSDYGGATELFEPADQYKGDLARSYLYMICAYEGKLTWKTNYMFDNDANGYTTINDWAKSLLLKWCRQDRVSDKERDRNNAVYKIQGNRNPFVDYPELVEYIWGDNTSSNFSLASAVSSYSDEYKSGTSGGESGESGEEGSDTETATTGTITFSSSDTKINAASVTGTDTNDNTWTITTEGTTSFTSNSAFCQVGSSSKPATSITFTMTLPSDKTISSFSAKFGGNSGTAGTVTLKVGDTEVGTGSLNASSDVTIANTSVATGTVLTVTVTGISKGVKCYNISYTYYSSSITFAAAPSLTSTCTFVGTQDVTITNNEDGATVYYTTDGTDPTTSSLSFTGESKTITLSATTTVKAMAVASDKNNSSIISATYTCEESIANTAETAYTTAEAIALIDAGSTQLATTEVYVKGTVSKVDSYNSSYGSLTYWLDDDAFEIYGGLGIDGAKFTATTDLQEGDVVVVKGYLTKYESTYEMSAGNVLISRVTTATQESPSFALGTYKTIMTAGDAADTYSVTTNSDGALSASSSSESVATVSIDGTTVTVTPVKAGTATITISCAETSKYYAASATYTLAVKTDYNNNFTWDLSKDETSSASETELLWENEYCSMAAEKGDATTATNNYYPGTEGKTYSSTRFYASSTLTFTPAEDVTLGTITFTATTADHAAALANSTWTNATATASTTSPFIVTIIPIDGTKAVSAVIGAKTGVTGVVVNYASSTDTSLPGDVDVDGDVDLADLTLLSSYLLDSSTAISATGLKNAELSGDETLNIVDLAKLIQLLNK